MNSKTDIESDNKQNSDSFRQIREKDILQVVINAVPTPIFYKDGKGRYLGCNEAFEQFVGRSRRELLGCSVFDLFESDLAKSYADDDARVFETGKMKIFEGRTRNAQGELRDMLFHKARFYAEREKIEGLVGVLIDITERKKIEREYQVLALTDTLTGLDNRLSLLRALDMALEKSGRNGQPVAFMMIDVDNFKCINDNFGHPVGDAFLIEAARRLKKTLRRSDFVARLGGDEFAVIIEGMGTRPQVLAVADKILHALSPPCQIERHRLQIKASIGIAMAPDDAATVENLMKYADIALYRAKAGGKSRADFYTD